MADHLLAHHLRDMRQFKVERKKGQERLAVFLRDKQALQEAVAVMRIDLLAAVG
jgi:hypothetical protein